MQILIFCALSLKMPIHAPGPKIGGLVGFYPHNGSSMNETPKGTSLGGNTSYNISIVKIGPLVLARREPKNKAKKLKGILKKPQQVYIFHVFAQTTHVLAAPHGFTLCGHTHYVVICSEFHRNPSMGFGAPGVNICPFPLLWLLDFTTACTTVQAMIKSAV